MTNNMRLVAIGGGNPASNCSMHVNTALDMTGKQRPRVLYIPTPKRTQDAYDLAIYNFTELYERKSGLNVEVLHPFDKRPSIKRTCRLMQWADMIYISGGDTRHAVRIWVESGISAILSQRVCAGTVVACGISAGALAWFTGGCSDSDSYDVDSNQPWQYCEVEALGLFNSLACPHYNTLHPQTKERRSSAFAQMLFTREQNYIGWGIDNHAALQVIGRTAKVLSAKDNFVHRLTRTKRGIRNAILTPSCGTFTI